MEHIGLVVRMSILDAEVDGSSPCISMFSPWARDFIRIASVDSAVKWVPGGDNLVNLICHDIDYFHVMIADMIHVCNNIESQLDELLRRKERKWIWDYCSITPYGLCQDYEYYCINKRCRKRYIKSSFNSASSLFGNLIFLQQKGLIAFHNMFLCVINHILW